MHVVNERANQGQNQHLSQRPLLIDRIYHLNVERRRLIESMHGVVKQDVGVFEEPGGDEKCERYADEARLFSHVKQDRENQDDRNGAAAQRAGQMAE